MPRPPVDLRVGGQSYRVVTSLDERDVLRLADSVDRRVRELTQPGRAISPQALLLAALTLAHDLEQERAARTALERRSREVLTSALARIDAALDAAAPPEPPDDSADELEAEL
ncbi:MAG: cell division protein ZapA [Polyangiaceae bacterium]|nr:cell division protein ZapA [Polyangiaceae bacterium]